MFPPSSPTFDRKETMVHTMEPSTSGQIGGRFPRKWEAANGGGATNKILKYSMKGKMMTTHLRNLKDQRQSVRKKPTPSLPIERARVKEMFIEGTSRVRKASNRWRTPLLPIRRPYEWQKDCGKKGCKEGKQTRQPRYSIGDRQSGLFARSQHRILIRGQWLRRTVLAMLY